MQNLRDKLLKAGLVDRKRKKRIEHQQRVARKTQPDRLEQEKKLLEQRVAEQQERKRERDRRLAEEQKLEAKRRYERLIKQREEEARRRRAESERLWRQVKARSLAEASMFLPAREGPVEFHFVSRSGGIRSLKVSTRIAHDLSRGALAIVQLPGWGNARFGLVRRDIAERLLEADPSLVRFFARSEGDLVELPPIVIDPPPARTRVQRFGSRADGDRRDR
ncbi:MAG: DUF2058 family protein [Deltaproteobacteria bacterium]|nr:MAG: DUF2058 family protein [Deltaproteobacteria bacterium]